MSDYMEKLDELRKKQPHEHTAEDRAFLKARKSYLRADEIALFKLEEEAAEEETGEESAVAKPAKKGKKTIEEE